MSFASPSPAVTGPGAIFRSVDVNFVNFGSNGR